MTKFTLHGYLWTYIIYPSSNKCIIGQNIENDTFNWTKLAQFMFSPTQCITFSRSLRVQNKDFRVNVWIFMQGKMYLHCTTKPDFFYIRLHYLTNKWLFIIYLFLFTISRLQNKHGCIVRTGFNCRNFVDVLTISTRDLVTLIKKIVTGGAPCLSLLYWFDTIE